MKRVITIYMIVFVSLLTACSESNESSCNIRYVTSSGEVELIKTTKTEGFTHIKDADEEIIGYYDSVLYNKEVTIDYCVDDNVIYAKQNFPESDMYLFYITEQDILVQEGNSSIGSFYTEVDKFYFNYLANYYLDYSYLIEYSDYLNLNEDEYIVQSNRNYFLTSEQRLIYVDISYINDNDINNIDNIYFEKLHSGEAIELATDVVKMSGDYVITSDKRVFRFYDPLALGEPKIVDKTSIVEDLIDAKIIDFYYHDGDYYVVDEETNVYYLKPWTILDPSWDRDKDFVDSIEVDTTYLDSLDIINILNNDIPTFNIDTQLFDLRKGCLLPLDVPLNMITDDENIIEYDYDIFYNYALTAIDLYIFNDSNYISFRNDINLEETEEILDIQMLDFYGSYNKIVLFTSLGRVFISSEISLLERINLENIDIEFFEVLEDYDIVNLTGYSNQINILTKDGKIVRFFVNPENGLIEVNKTLLPLCLQSYKISYNQYTNIEDIIEALYGNGYSAYTTTSYETEFEITLDENGNLKTAYVYIK